MNKKTEKEVNRLNVLADFIEANPKQFAITDGFNCILAWGGRLLGRGKHYMANACDFAKAYGVPYEVAEKLYIGRFKDIVGSPYKNVDLVWDEKYSNKKTNTRTVKTLRWLAKQKSEGKILETIDKNS